MTALWINNPGFDTDHCYRGGMLTKTPPPTGLQIPATVTTLANTQWISGTALMNMLVVATFLSLGLEKEFHCRVV